MASADNHRLASHLADECIGGHGTVSWDQDSDVLRTLQSMCSFITNSSIAAGHWCVSLYSMFADLTLLSSANLNCHTAGTTDLSN